MLTVEAIETMKGNWFDGIVDFDIPSRRGDETASL